MTEDEIASDIRRRWRTEVYGSDAARESPPEVGRLLLVIGESLGWMRALSAVAAVVSPRLAADVEDDADRLRRETEMTLERMRPR